MKKAEERGKEILSLCFFPPEIPPPAPLQTQDGSAVATNGHLWLFLVHFFFLFLCFFTCLVQCSRTLL